MLGKNGKNELIGTILDELKELELLTQGFQDPQKLQELAVKKAQDLLQHYQQLDLSVAEEEDMRAEKQLAAEKAAAEKAEAQRLAAKQAEAERLAKEARLAAEKEESDRKAAEEAEIRAKAEQAELARYAAERAEKERAANEAMRAAREKAEADQKQRVQATTPNNVGSSEPSWQSATKGTVTNNDRYKQSVSPSIGESGVKRVDIFYIKSLKSALNLNDKIRYSRELFGGNSELLNSTIDELDRMQNLGEALTYIHSHFNWNEEDEAVAEFLSLLERRF